VSRDGDLEDKAKTTEMNTFARNLLKSIPVELSECLPDGKCVLRMLQRWKQKKREKEGLPKSEAASEKIPYGGGDQSLALPTRKYEKMKKKKKPYPRAICPNCKERFGVMKLASHFQECRATRPAKNLRDAEDGEDHQVHGGGQEDRNKHEEGGCFAGEEKGDADYCRAGGHQRHPVGQCEGQSVSQAVVCVGQ